MATGPTNTLELKKIKSSLIISKKQRELIIGTILGDGCLITSRSGKAARLQIRHNIKHKEYVEWKYSFLYKWVLTPPRLDSFNNSWYFRTLSHPSLMEIKRSFYRKNQRFVPNDIKTLLKSPLSLAVWLMDDGNGYRSYKGFRVSSYGFGFKGNQLLKECLMTNFSLFTSITKDEKGYQLLFPKKSALQMIRLVEPYIISCMKYKFASLTP